MSEIKNKTKPEIKVNEPSGIKPKFIVPETQNEFNQAYIDDLMNIKETYDSVPTYIPKKLLDQIYLYKNGATYRLYIYINNEWKYTALS